MDDIQKQFEVFISDLNDRLEIVGVNLSEQIIDHICYRVTTLEDFETLSKLFAKNSKLYTDGQFNGRNFHIYLLEKGLVYKNIIIFTLEFSEPGGNDKYKKGFQHIEILTKLPLEKLSTKPDEMRKFLEVSSHGEGEILKWPDKFAVKFKSIPLIVKSIVVDGAKPIT